MVAAPLLGKVALVTGGARRLGRHLVLALARSGADLLIHHHAGGGAAVAVALEVRALGRRAEVLRADLRQEDAIVAMVAEARTRFPRLDLLVNSAADFERCPLADLTADRWDAMLALNLRAPMLLTRECAPWLRQGGGGSIVNIADVAGIIPWAHHLHYAVAKAGLVALTRDLALELAPSLRVNAVAPGTVLPAAGQDEAELERLRRRTPLKELASPEAVAATVVFLATTPGVTGQVVAVDGGRSLQFGE